MDALRVTEERRWILHSIRKDTIMIYQKLLIDGNHFKLILILLMMVISAGCREMTSSEYIKWITDIEIPEDSEFLGAEIENEIVDAPAFYKVKFTSLGWRNS